MSGLNIFDWLILVILAISTFYGVRYGLIKALFSILGATYGGDGRTTFGLPDLRGRVAVHPGDCGGDCSPVRLGEQGAENKIRQPPPAGAGWPVIHARHPYTAINYIIAVQGIYPSRS